MFALEQSTPKPSPSYVVYDNVIPLSACKEIISLSAQYPKHEGKQGSSAEKRTSDIHWLPHSEQLDDLYKRLAEVVLQANNEFWNFHLAGFLEPLQLTHYEAKNKGHYNWHTDTGPNGILQCRKISGSLILNEEYGGGELELFDQKPIGKPKPGSLILFPSYHLHRVSSLTKGERWSLVFWVTGPKWL